MSSPAGNSNTNANTKEDPMAKAKPEKFKGSEIPQDDKTVNEVAIEKKEEAAASEAEQ